ncbi:MAG: hypothetical protein K1W15_01810 [Lachnospiraceae bacterium]
MKVKLRNELDFNQPVNLHRLSPAMKIYAGMISKWHESSMYKQKCNRSTEAANVARMQKDESLKGILLANIFRAFGEDAEVAKRGKICKSVVLQIDAAQKRALDRVLKNRDFLSYDIEFVKENPDIRKAFANMPYLLRVSKKVLE